MRGSPFLPCHHASLIPSGRKSHGLIPQPEDHHPLGCRRRRISDRVFDLLANALEFGVGYRRISGNRCSATTLRRRRDEWTRPEVIDRLERPCREADERMIGLKLDNVAVGGCLTKAPCGGEILGRNLTDRRKSGIERSTSQMRAACRWVSSSHRRTGATPHCRPNTLDTLEHFGSLPETTCVHLDAGYGSHVTRALLAERGLQAGIARKGLPAPVQATKRWPAERTHAWHNRFLRLARCTERRQAVADFCLARLPLGRQAHQRR